MESYNEWNILFDNLKQYFNSDGIIYNITANNIIKILTEYAVGNIIKCGKCQGNVLILKTELRKHGKYYDFNNGEISEFICNNCDIMCDICEESTGYHICCGLISKHPKKYLCEDCVSDCIQCGHCLCYGEICDFCRESICDECAANCDICTEIIICNTCGNSCDDCQDWVCGCCIHHCSKCDKSICDECTRSCNTCYECNSICDDCYDGS